MTDAQAYTILRNVLSADRQAGIDGNAYLDETQQEALKVALQRLQPASDDE